MHFSAISKVAPSLRFPAARQFANRDQELATVAQRVDILIQGGDVPNSIINVYGVPGIGKTALFAKLESIYYTLEQIVMVALSLAGFGKRHQTDDLFSTKLGFLELFLQQLPEPIRQSAQHELKQYPTEDITEAHLNATLTHCTEALRKLDKPLLLIVDAWEDTPESIFSWFERTSLLPLVQQNHCICVFGSQSELRWRQFEVRRRVQPYPLKALDKEALQKQTETEQNGTLGDLIFQMTSGHPLASETVYEQLQDGTSSEQWWLEHRRAVAEAVVSRMYERTHKEMSDELRDILEVISLFREFDVNTLRYVVSQFIPVLKGLSQSALLIRIKQLLETQFVTWNDELRAYQLDPAVRKIFAYAVELKDPERFQEIHAVAAQYYAGLIRDVPGNRSVYIAEFYYHSLYKRTDDLYNEEDVKKTFQTFFDRYYTNHDGSLAHPTLLKSLREQLEDEELQSVFAAHNLPPTLLVEVFNQRL